MNDENINIDEQLDILEETKSQIKQAIIGKGQPVSDLDSFRSYAQKIEDISTMNAQAKSVTPTTSPQLITPDENFNALSQVTVEAVDNNIDANILSENIRNGVTILGVTGTVEEGIDTSDATALDDDIALGKTAYVDGQKITGTFSIEAELTAQENKLEALETILENKVGRRKSKS